jgi:hypothetical protein
MSKLRKPICSVLPVFACLVVWPWVTNAQYLEAAITIDPTLRTATVRGKWTSGAVRRNLSLLPSAIGAPDLGRRISDVELKNAAWESVPCRAFNSAEYVAEADFANFSYKLDLRPPPDPRSAAHASWIGLDEGLVFPDDILPQAIGKESKGAVVSLVVNGGWRLISTERASRNGVYHVGDLERSIFVIGKNIRQTPNPGVNGRFAMAASGRWLFDDPEAVSMADEIYKEYVKSLGGDPAIEALVVLLPIPQTGVQKGIWEAETRGSTVIIASSDMPFKTQSLQRLHEQLRHEIFHLWLPNGVNLTGRYDWFYEGFALYQSLKTAVALNRIRFEDFLDTLSRAHDIDRSQTRRLSLITASQERWNAADTQVYARGMVIAFLSDLILLEGSSGKNSVEVLLAKLFSVHKYPAAAADANTAVLKLFDADPRLGALANDYIRGDKPVDWIGIIDIAGLENEPGPNRRNLRIKPKLSGRQKALLDKLGYNNWRKLTQK